MGYWMFIFNHKQWYELYAKNCSLKTESEWYAAGNANIPLGLTYLTLGVVFELTYIPFLFAMLKPEFIQYSCYKFMFLIGMMDIFIVPCNGIITGIQCMLGIHFCIYPQFFYIVGTIGCTGFYGVTTSCVVLAFDRFLEMCSPNLAKSVFGKKRVYFWLALPIMYMLYVGFQMPHLYNTKRYSYSPDPFLEIPGMKNNSNFHFDKFETFFTINNTTIIVSLTIFYSSMLVILKINSIFYGIEISQLQKLMTLQALCICGEMFVAPLLHIFMLYIQFPVVIEIIAHIGWIGIHGDTPIVYLILNKSLRTIVLEMIAPWIKIPQTWLSRSYRAVSSISRARNHVAPINPLAPTVSYVELNVNGPLE